MGSPPNAWMFLFTQSRASLWSSIPKFRLSNGSCGDRGNPNTSSRFSHSFLWHRYTDGISILTVRSIIGSNHNDILICSKAWPVVKRIRTCSKSIPTAEYPEQYRFSLVITFGPVDVQIQAVFALPRCGRRVEQRLLKFAPRSLVAEILYASWRAFGSMQGLMPGQWVFWWWEPKVLDWRFGKRDTEKLMHCFRWAGDMLIFTDDNARIDGHNWPGVVVVIVMTANSFKRGGCWSWYKHRAKRKYFEEKSHYEAVSDR